MRGIRDVRFTPISGLAHRQHQCLLCAISRHSQARLHISRPASSGAFKARFPAPWPWGTRNPPSSSACGVAPIYSEWVTNHEACARLQSQTTAAAISSGRPSRPIGLLFEDVFRDRIQRRSARPWLPPQPRRRHCNGWRSPGWGRPVHLLRSEPSSWTSATVTAAPASAKALAVARPMPETAPVTSATLSLKDQFTNVSFYLKRLLLPHGLDDHFYGPRQYSNASTPESSAWASAGALLCY